MKFTFNARKCAASLRMTGIPAWARKMHGHPARFLPGVEIGFCGILEVFRDWCDITKEG